MEDPDQHGDLEGLLNSKPRKFPIRLIIIVLVIIIIIALFIILLVVLLSNNDEKKQEEILFDISDGHPKIYANDPEYVYIPLFGTNDMHGFVFPRIVDINDKLSYKNSSLEYFGKYIEIIRKEFGEERVLWLDGGDQQTGGVELVTSNNEIMTAFMNSVQITAATIGNHEFDLNYDVFSEKIKKSNFPYLSGNVYDNRTHEFRPISNGTSEKNGHKKYIIKEIKLSNNDIIKIGIIGVGAKMDEVGENAISSKGWDFFEFHEIKDTIEQEVKEIKEQYPDLNAIIGTIHAGMNCFSNHELNLYTKNMSQNICEGELYDILTSISSGLLDAVISGDRSFIVHDWINDIPVISTLDGGQYTNIMYLPFKKINNVYKLIKDEVKIESPLPNCEKIFNNTKICDKVSNEEDYKLAGSLINFKYRGVKMDIPSSINDLINTYYPAYKEYNEDEVCYLYGLNFSIYGKDRSGDAYVPNLIGDITKNITKSDFVLLNTGGLRATWDMGKLTKAEIFSMLPFEDYFCTADVYGKDLKYILSVVQVGEKAYYANSGLKQKIKIYNNGTKEFLEASLWVDGKEVEIEDDKLYKFGTIDYIVINYGDDFAKIKTAGYEFKNVVCESTDSSLNWNLRIIEELKKFDKLDISKYVDKEHPRIVEVKE